MIVMKYDVFDYVVVGAGSAGCVAAARLSEDSNAMSRVVDAYVEAAVEAGHPSNADFNGAAQLGVGRHQLTQFNGMRWSTADAYLRPALDRKNLTVITEALAHRVLFDGKRATEVEISTCCSRAEVQLLRAEREVVRAVGTYGS